MLCTAVFFILLAAIVAWGPVSPSTRKYAYIFLNTYFLLLTIAAFGFLCSVLIRNQRAALSVSGGIVLFGFVVAKVLSFLALCEENSDARVIQWLNRLTPFHYADPIKVLVTGKVDWGDNLILVLVATALLSAALVLFRRKDIAA